MKRISFNSPVILVLTAVSALVLLANWLTGGVVNEFLAMRRTSWLSPLMYLRMLTSVFAHANLAHFSANFVMMLAVGPMVEEKYGSRRLVLMMVMTAVVTGVVSAIFFPRVALIGASGLVFLVIILASFTNMKQGQIPLTFILVAVVYIGNEIIAGVVADDNVSQLAHIVGGVCGAIFGYLTLGGRKKTEPTP
ncbi:MAG: rhomboid family intramembrane serine protease [Propionibacteriaceae bacterium]|nr:rhomboid family intramembrane serine protease [Propionibacteriaceae bacterium]